MSLTILEYDHERDWQAVKRIHYEIAWLKNEEDAKEFEPLAQRFGGVVCPIDGEAECAVFTAPGAVRHNETDVDMTAVTGVMTSRVARKLGAAKVLTAHALAKHADEGSEVASLGMFDQGFYNRLGFGNGSYERRIRFDPATLSVDSPFRRPKRIGREQWRDVYTAMQNRLRGHGSSVLDIPEIILYDMSPGNVERDIGLGYYDGPDNTLSHFFWGSTDGEYGPYDIYLYAYQTAAQLFELLALIKSLGDQVSLFEMQEPAEIQFQDLLKQPFRNRRMTRGSKFAGNHETYGYWQTRMLDVSKCLAKTRLDTESVAFNLELSDPIEEHLDGANAWRGCAGNYIVTLGEQSSAELGWSANLPILKASVGAFTRLWLGVREASSLALTDDLHADAELLRALDRAVRLPQPYLGWDF